MFLSDGFEIQCYNHLLRYSMLNGYWRVGCLNNFEEFILMTGCAKEIAILPTDFASHISSTELSSLLCLL